MAVTVFSPSPAFNANDANPSTNFRSAVKLSAASNGQLRVRFRAPTVTNALQIIGAAFGKLSSTTINSGSCDMTTAAFRLTFAGSNGGTAPAGGTLTSDLITHTGVTLAAGDWIVVTFYCGSTTATGGQRCNTSGSSTICATFAGSPDKSQQQNAISGWSSVTVAYPVNLTTMTNGANFAIDLIETNDPAGGSPYTMAAGQGTLAAAGQAARLARSRKMAAANGALTLAGPVVNLLYSGAGPKTMPAGVGFLALSGRAATLRRTRIMPAVTGTLTLAGQASALRYAHKTPAGQGALTSSGQNVTLRYSRKMPAGLGTITLLEPVVNLIYSGAGAKSLPAGVGFPRLEGQPVTLRYTRKLVAANGVLALGGQLAILTHAELTDFVMTAATGVVGLTGCDVTLSITRRPPVMVQETLRFGRPIYINRW